ncbi:flagellar export protein FliJ [Undibacterium sp.]|uniref:flagellar export protein FliJ n=1 Tax=Undibacterium sp. TaxID=1914977 RepID=UPI0025DD0889|nr:flagellar export protein FliJ [Undibacterium sp.]MCX7219261.1 flagellar export protein FliJ [Burkholderiales bacterium]
MQKSPISTLIELAEKNSDEAAKRLGKTIHAHEETEKQLKLLLQYREDYQQRFQDGAAKGLSAAQYGNFISFICKLDGAVDGQKQVVRDAEYKITMARSVWQESEKKRLSYNTLQGRTQTALQKKEAKRDQKNTDEHAARSFFYKR